MGEWFRSVNFKEASEISARKGVNVNKTGVSGKARRIIEKQKQQIIDLKAQLE